MYFFSREMLQGTTGRLSSRDREQTMPGTSPQAPTSCVFASKTAALPFGI